MLRVATAGSVDDGKSTLIGRLLFDAKALMADQEAGLEDLANLTDGLRAEREQGITIDVAYRHFATPRRRFVLHDCPGHAQYTRNMVTGASTADLAVILVDARRGLTEQSRRHAALAGLLGVPQITVCVNKMDLVGYAEERFDAVVREFLEFAAGAGLSDITFIPVSALHGDNVVDRSRGDALVRGRAAARPPRGRARGRRRRRRPGPPAGPVRHPRRRRAPLRAARRPASPGTLRAGRRGRRAALGRPQPRGARGRPARRRSATPPRPPRCRSCSRTSSTSAAAT